MNAEQAHASAFSPVVMKERPNVRENRVIAAGRLSERVCAGDGVKVGIAQLQLEGPRFEFLLAQTARDHFSEPCQGCLKYLEIGGVFAKGVLVADGFRRALADLFVKPAAGVFAACFARD